MRELWLRLRSDITSDLKADLLRSSANTCTCALVDEGDVDLARKSGVKTIASPKGGDVELLSIRARSKIGRSIRVGRRVAVYITVKNPEDLKAAVAIADLGPEYVVVSCPDWKVIPLENLVAELHGKCKLLAQVANPKEAIVALEALELGADGIVLEATDPKQLTKTSESMRRVRTRAEERGEAPRVEIIPAKVVSVKPAEVGARVCIDTCDIMRRGEGMLVGSQSSGLFLVQAEVEESGMTSPRPFRVNAGPVSSYVLAPGGKTKYLSEIKAGSEVLIVDRKGKTRSAVVGRSKIEWRPLVLVEARARDKTIKTLLQNAETIRLVTPEGSKAVTDLKAGDNILAHIEEGGRHFGKLVREETVLEW